MLGTTVGIRGTHRRTFVVRVALSASLALAGAAGAPPAAADSLTGYVALGDSFSSGEGAPPYDTGTDTPDVNMCHRSSTAAYPALVRDALTLTPFRFAACSGAETQHFLHNKRGPGGWKEGAQLDEIASEVEQDPFVTLVTLTVGGNDSEFAKVLEKCIAVDSILDTTTDAKCQRAGDHSLKVGVNQVTKKLPRILDGIHGRAPNARIRVLLYPVFVDTDLVEDCTVGVLVVDQTTVTFKLTTTRADMFEDWFEQLNTAISTQVAAWAALHPDVDADVVPTADAFVDHELCSDDPTDVNGLTFDAKNKPARESFHPTAAGHMKLADAVIASLAP